MLLVLSLAFAVVAIAVVVIVAGVPVSLLVFGGAVGCCWWCCRC